MAIKDTIVPGFVGTTTIKWLPTRGYSIASVSPPDMPGFEYDAKDERLHYDAGDVRLHYDAKDDRLHGEAFGP